MRAEKQSTMHRSFGRRRGRKLRASRSELMATLLPELLVASGEKIPATCNLQLATPLWFEIGFGAGEHLAEQARQNPHVQFIGCEPYVNGMAHLLAEIQAHSLTNIRLYDDDARLLLTKLPDHCIEKLFVLFPDPWPKARHHKKRLVSLQSLALFHRKLVQGGALFIATDHEGYAAWILEKLLASGEFEWQVQSHVDWDTPPVWWVKTRYQKKAESEGRKAVFLHWTAK